MTGKDSLLAAGLSHAATMLEVDDVEAAYRDLSDRGVEFLTPPQRPPWGGLRCFVRDPDGYLVEVEQPHDPERPAREEDGEAGSG